MRQKNRRNFAPQESCKNIWCRHIGFFLLPGGNSIAYLLREKSRGFSLSGRKRQSFFFFGRVTQKISAIFTTSRWVMDLRCVEERMESDALSLSASALMHHFKTENHSRNAQLVSPSLSSCGLSLHRDGFSHNKKEEKKREKCTRKYLLHRKKSGRRR